MNKIHKHLFILILLAVVSACAPSNLINKDVEQIFNTALEIADLDLPDGYEPDFYAHLMGYTVASFSPGDGHSHIYLIQSDSEADGEKLAEMLNQLAPGAYDPQTRMSIIETRPIMVRGQEATLVVSEGVTSEDESYRQEAVAFQGQGGPALVVISAPIESWDQTVVDVFLASIR